MKTPVLLLFFLLLFAACSEQEAPECISLEDAAFDETSGWQLDTYAPETTDLGCYPFRTNAPETFEGGFSSMRTAATSAEQAGACQQVLETLNCKTFSDEGDNELGFFVTSADRFAVRIVGRLATAGDVDTTLYMNPCDPGCLAAVTLTTLHPSQQKICEIARQGKAHCLFDESAHTVSFSQVDESSVVLRMNGEQVPMSLVGGS